MTSLVEKTGENSNGSIYSGNGFMVFEDAQNGDSAPEYYGWLGGWDSHDSADHITFSAGTTLEEAATYMKKEAWHASMI
jgi:hypothetical protein